MQRLSDLIQAMKDTRLPWTFYEFGAGKAPPLPYLVYLLEESDDVFADGENYVPIQSVSMELYTTQKSRETEQLVEDCLRGNGIRWAKSEEYLDDEQCYEVIYDFQLIIDTEGVM